MPLRDSVAALAVAPADAADGAALLADCTAVELDADCARAAAAPAKISASVARADKARRVAAANFPFSTCSLILAPLQQKIFTASQPFARDSLTSSAPARRALATASIGAFTAATFRAAY